MSISSHLVLGSQSPRRREILSYFDLPFEQADSSFDESSVPFRANPEEYVTALARGKGEALHWRYPHSAILTADTIVYRAGKVYGKPLDIEHAKKMLAELSGEWHSVFTAVALRRSDQLCSIVEETRVQFNPITDLQIEQYCNKLHLGDKAGSYQMQMAGGLIVRRIEGCYYNVVGLPINGVRVVLKSIGIELWEHLK